MDNLKLFCYRYMWTSSSSKSVNLKIVTDTELGIAQFENAVKESCPDIKIFGREYLYEVDVSRISHIENLLYENDVTYNNENKKDGD